MVEWLNFPISRSFNLPISQFLSRHRWVDLREGFRYLWGWSGAMALIGGALIFKVALTTAFKLYLPGPV